MGAQPLQIAAARDSASLAVAERIGILAAALALLAFFTARESGFLTFADFVGVPVGKTRAVLVASIALETANFGAGILRRGGRVHNGAFFLGALLSTTSALFSDAEISIINVVLGKADVGITTFHVAFKDLAALGTGELNALGFWLFARDSQLVADVPIKVIRVTSVGGPNSLDGDVQVLTRPSQLRATGAINVSRKEVRRLAGNVRSFLFNGVFNEALPEDTGGPPVIGAAAFNVVAGLAVITVQNNGSVGPHCAHGLSILEDLARQYDVSIERALCQVAILKKGKHKKLLMSLRARETVKVRV